MPKHARKRQKTEKNASEATTKTARLEMLLNDDAKDDEEKQLESMLFGTKYTPKDKGKQKERFGYSDDERTSSEEDEGNDEGGGQAFRHLMDDDLFFVDDGDAPALEEESATSQSGSGSDSEESDGASSSARSRPRKTEPLFPTTGKPKVAAWADPGDLDTTNRVSLTSGPSRLRKLRQTVDESEISGREYETRLRAQFERLHPEPSWAKKARRGKQKGGDSSAEEEEEGIDDLVAATNGLVATHGRSKTLAKGSISIERVRDVNHSVQSSTSGEARVVSFHPKPSVPVLCVATADRRVRLFNVDGHLSPLLTTLHFPSLPLASSSSVLFHPQGNSLLISGPRPFFYTYDLQQGTSTLHRRGLWGSESDHASLDSSSKRRKRGANTSGGGGKGGGGNTEVMLQTAFSPGRGSLLAVAGRDGNVSLVDWSSGAGQVIGSLKCNTGSGGIRSLSWVPQTSGSVDSDHLAVLTGEAEVYIWDVGQRRCVKRWKDQGGYRGGGRTFAMGGGQDGWTAIGSTSGFVNVYGGDSFSLPADDDLSPQKPPKVLKELGQLTTPISTLHFNHDSQLLAMASKDKKDAMRLVHLPSLTAFANWPTSSTPLGHVTAVDFAPQSEYLAIGNTRGKVLLYHLRDYGAGSKQN